MEKILGRLKYIFKKFFKVDKFLVVKIALILFVLGYKFIFSGPKELVLKPSHFEFVKLGKNDIRSVVSATGFINPVNVVTVGSQLSGMIDKIYVDYNDKVKNGQMLAQVDTALLKEEVISNEAQVRQMKSRLDLAKVNAERTEQLFKEGYIAKLELDQVITDLASADANYVSAVSNLERAKRNMGYAEIKSPVSGVVISRDVEEGQTIASSFSAPTLFTIAEDLTKMQIEASISEADIGHIKKGQDVNFTVDAFPSEKFNGEVYEIRLNPTTEQNVVIYNVIIRIDNKDLLLLPGMTAFVEVDTLNKKDVLALDNYVLQYKPDEILNTYVRYPEGKRLNVGEGFVYIFNVDDKIIEARKVMKGITNGVVTEILSENRKEGEEVIADFTYDGEFGASKSFNPGALMGRGGPGSGGRGGPGGGGAPRAVSP